MTSINSIPSSPTTSNINFEKTNFEKKSSNNKNLQNDEVTFTKPSAPKISRIRLFFNRLTDEQINQVNESGRLPQNAKFYPNGTGGYYIGNDFFNITAGTKQLPAGFELQKSLLGFTRIVPKGTEGLFIDEAE